MYRAKKGNIINVFKSLTDIKEKLNIENTNSIANVCKNKKYCHTAFGYGWSYYPQNTWKPIKKHQRTCKKITIGNQSYTYQEWSLKLGISKDHFRHLYYEINKNPQKLEEFIKKNNLKN